MKYIAAYTLLVLGGNATPSAEDVTTLITSVGGEVCEDKLNALIADLEGKDIHELLAKGEDSLKSVVGVAAAPAAASGAAPAAAPAAAPSKPKEEEVDALDGGMDMFGGGSKGSDY